MVSRLRRVFSRRRKSVSDPRVSFELPLEELELLASQLSKLQCTTAATCPLSAPLQPCSGPESNALSSGPTTGIGGHNEGDEGNGGGNDGVLSGSGLSNSSSSSSAVTASFRLGSVSTSSSFVLAGELDNRDDAKTRDWLARYPNANDSFEAIGRLARGRKLAVFLDYDGTLTPIVRDPDRAFMSREMRDSVRACAQVFPTAIISGRGREKVQAFVHLEELYYAGSHGLDIVGPKNGKGARNGAVVCQPAADFAPQIDAVHKDLLKAVDGIVGAAVEHNKFCLSVHFRNCSEDSWDALRRVVEKTVAKHKQLKITRGRKVLEVRPKVDWDKGKAVQHLLKALDLDGDNVMPLYLGDDLTDEDAFRVMKKRKTGVGILVSSKIKQTEAKYHLRDPMEVLFFLKRLVKLAQNRNGITSWKVERQGFSCD